mgnify:CR=1
MALQQWMQNESEVNGRPELIIRIDSSPIETTDIECFICSGDNSTKIS